MFDENSGEKSAFFPVRIFKGFHFQNICNAAGKIRPNFANSFSPS